MAEEETKEETSEETTEDETRNDSEDKEVEGAESSDTQSPIDEMNKATERAEKANVEKKKLLDREEKLLVEHNLRGRAVAGKPVENDDEKWAREAKIRYAGTGMDPTPITN